MGVKIWLSPNGSLLHSEDVHHIKCDCSNGELKFIGSYKDYKVKCIQRTPQVKPMSTSAYNDGIDVLNREMERYSGGKANPTSHYLRSHFDHVIRIVGFLGLFLVVGVFLLKHIHFGTITAGIVFDTQPDAVPPKPLAEPPQWLTHNFIIGHFIEYLLFLNVLGAFGFTCGFIYAFGLLTYDTMVSMYFAIVGGCGFYLFILISLIKHYIYGNNMYGIRNFNPYEDEVTAKLGFNYWLFVLNFLLLAGQSMFPFFFIGCALSSSKTNPYFLATTHAVVVLRREWKQYGPSQTNPYELFAPPDDPKLGWKHLCFNHSEVLSPGIALRLRGDQNHREWTFETYQITWTYKDLQFVKDTATTSKSKSRNSTPRPGSTSNRGSKTRKSNRALLEGSSTSSAG